MWGRTVGGRRSGSVFKRENRLFVGGGGGLPLFCDRAVEFDCFTQSSWNVLETWFQKNLNCLKRRSIAHCRNCLVNRKTAIIIVKMTERNKSINCIVRANSWDCICCVLLRLCIEAKGMRGSAPQILPLLTPYFLPSSSLITLHLSFLLHPHIKYINNN